MTRVAVLDRDRCRPRDCDLVCYRFCPMVRSKIEAIKFESEQEQPLIVEALCTGCGICIKKCPFEAISIVNLPDELEEARSHRFGPNAFKLYRLPIPESKAVLGLIGKNGVGKSTALKILAGEIKPNLGDFENAPDWVQIIRSYRGSVLQEYFEKLSEGQLKVVHKPQYVDRVPEAVSRTRVKEVLKRTDERGKLDEVTESLQLDAFLDRRISVLSGGELQRVAIAAAICRDADVYLFDEPSSFLDAKQRIEAAKAIRGLTSDGKMVVVAEHDLAVLDYLSDHVCILYGKPGTYGIVSSVYGVRTGINLYLGGYLPEENVRFRNEPIKFHVKPPVATWETHEIVLKWGRMRKSYDKFTLTTGSGEIHNGEVVGILGPNGIGKTTFVKLLAGMEKPDEVEYAFGGLTVSYKPQYISAEYEGTVETLLRLAVKDDLASSLYRAEILQPLSLETILDRDVAALSGGELQRTAIAVCLSRKADLYLLDEPSAYLDVEERLEMARTIRRIVESRGTAAFVVEHDIATQDFIVDRIMVFGGEAGVEGHANSPTSLREGMNAFLKDMEVTFRRDPNTGRPRVNKEGSRLDRYQKNLGEYYYEAESGED